MRSFLAKIFACMLLVPILSRGGGMLLQATLNDPRPPSERALSAVLPATASLAASVLAQRGPGGVEAALSGAHGLLTLLPAASLCRDPAVQAVVVPIPGAGGACLAAHPPPRPLILGVVPATWWSVLPALELLWCCVVSFFLARYLALPILRTRAAATAFAAGDLAARAAPARPGRRRDEAADLEREFDRMADRVAAMIAAQRRFIGDVSHEIRSPLARLAMALGLARREAGPALAPQFDRMEHEIESVSGLVRELLALASLEGAVGPPRAGPVDLGALLDQVIDDMGFEFHERAHAIRTLRKPGTLQVRGDAALLRRAIENVLRNALFYTPEGTQVEALLDGDSVRARVVIRDHGPGVPEAALPQLFQPFFRVDEARARNTGGAGLGLAITRRAIELHGGHIEACNARPHGLIVRIELPRAAAEAEAPGAAAARDAYAGAAP